MDLTIKSERVLDAAAAYPDAKRVLEKLFPEAFVPKLNTFEEALDALSGGCIVLKSKGGFTILIQVRTGGEYKGKALYLNGLLNWELKKDSDGVTVLIGTPK